MNTGKGGSSVFTRQDLVDKSTTIISCPFSLAIDHPLAKSALSGTLGVDAELNERETICTYITLHWCARDTSFDSKCLQHWPYIASMPCMEDMLTPLFMRTEELYLLSGTNLYYAALDRKAEWEKEWERCREVIRCSSKSEWTDSFTWERYLLAASYLSSRAFPSTLLSSRPSLYSPETSYPVLLPGIDSLNHGRGEKVTWVVNEREAQVLDISLELEGCRKEGQEILNNYGLKSNAELILGYGFSIRDNPEDCVVIKLGGAWAEGKRIEIGDDVEGLEDVLKEMRSAYMKMTGWEGEEMESELEVLDTLQEMMDGLGAKMEACEARMRGGDGVRESVREMCLDYIRGQLRIVDKINGVVRQKWEEACMHA